MSDKFRYQLDSFLRKCRLDRDVAHTEETEAHRIVMSRRKDLERVQKTISATQQQLRAQCVQGGDLDPERQRLLSEYLLHQQDELKKKRLDVEKAEKVHAESARKLETTFRDVRKLEKHRELRRGQFLMDWQRKEQKRADELWLTRARRGRAKG